MIVNFVHLRQSKQFQRKFSKNWYKSARLMIRERHISPHQFDKFSTRIIRSLHPNKKFKLII